MGAVAGIDGGIPKVAVMSYDLHTVVLKELTVSIKILGTQ